MLFKYFIRFQVLTLFLATVVLFQNCGGQVLFRNSDGSTNKILTAGGTNTETPPAPTDIIDEGGNDNNKPSGSLGLCWVPQSQGNGQSQRISIDIQSVSIKQGVAKDACITRVACQELLPPHFNNASLQWKSTAVCEHNKNVDRLSDAQVVAILTKN